MDWYDTLKKSSLTPPNYVFNVVWTLLYLLMFVGFAKVLHVTSDVSVITFFIIQLLLNLSWTPIFFKYHNIPLSFIVIILLLICVMIMTYKFYLHEHVAGLMQIPYIIWLCLATYLDWYILKYNSF